MTRIDKVLKNLSELYEFHRKLKAYELKKGANHGVKLTANKTAAFHGHRSAQGQAAPVR
jgi:hypothetical protein